MDVRKYRLELGLSQKELAYGAKIPRHRIAKWEVGKGNPKVGDDQKLRIFFKANNIEIEQDVTNSSVLDIELSPNPVQILINAINEQGLTSIQIATQLGIEWNEYQKIEKGEFEKQHKKDIKAIDRMLGTNLYGAIYQKEYEASYKLPNKLIRLYERKIIDHLQLMQVPYLPIYAQASYLKHYAINGKKIDKNVGSICVYKEQELGYYMAIEIADNSMNSKTERAICNKDKLLIQEVKKDIWTKETFHYKHQLFVLFTKHHSVLCREIVKYDSKKGFLLHAWDKHIEDIAIAIKEVYRLFLVKKIIERGVGNTK